MLKFIKEYIRNKTLRVKRLNPPAVFVNMQDVHSIGFLYNISTPEFLEDLNNIISFLDKKGILYYGLAIETKKGLLPQMERINDMPEYIKELSIKDISFVERIHLNWIGVPNSDKIDEFVKREFDVFISFNDSGDFTLEYILMGIKTKFIVGMYNNPNSPYTLVLEGENKTMLGYMEYLNQIFHYLNIIKSGKAVKFNE